MANRNCSTYDITAAINQELSLYSKEVTKKVKKCCKKAADEMTENIRKDSPKRTGKYKKSWKNEKLFENANDIRYRTYNEKHYQLTHLLEYGHAKKGGGRVEGKAHIKPNELKTKIKLEQEIRREVST